MKAWRNLLAQHVTRWSNSLPPYRAWWPKYVYHFTNVANAVNILRYGQLLFRDAAIGAGLMATDNASAAVIGQTTSDHLKLARMYFRPRTPTSTTTKVFDLVPSEHS